MGFQFSEECVKSIEDWDGIMSAPSPQNRKRLDGIQVFENRFMEKYFGMFCRLYRYVLRAMILLSSRTNSPSKLFE